MVGSNKQDFPAENCTGAFKGPKIPCDLNDGESHEEKTEHETENVVT